MADTGLNRTEKKASLTLASVFGLRMLGLFMILPVFAIYGVHLEGYSPIWLGLAIGAYGLTQALLQIPMGLLSDKIGRKPVIIGGLIVFLIGSIVAAMSDTVYGVVFGRALQGMGAIASAILALAADLSREEQRPKVMATIGMFIGLSFAAAMVLGPLIAHSFGLAGLFWLTAILSFVGVFVVAYLVPNSVHKAPKGDNVAAPKKILGLIRHPQLIRLDFGVFVLHLVLTAMFVCLPQLLIQTGFQVEDHWQLYFPALIGSFIVMVPYMIWAIKTGKEKQAYCGAIALMAFSLVALWQFNQSFWGLVALVVVFFTAFNYLEATMPSIMSRISPAGDKGTAMGVYSSSQFFGAFMGGFLGGVIQEYYTSETIFLASAGLIVLWFIFALGMPVLVKSKSFSFKTSIKDEAHADSVVEKLIELPGVIEATLVHSEEVAYLKINEKVADIKAIKALLRPETAA